MSLEAEIIDYNDHKSDIEHWVLLKGELRYRSIIEFLKSKNIKCTWDNVTYYVKYDKRLLLNAFKYIVFLEEMYKSFIYKFKGLNASGKTFRDVYNEFLKLGDKANYDDVNLFVMSKNNKSFISFRNDVVHNKILINKTFSGLSLEEVLREFVKILPASYRNGFIKDINDCSKKITDDKWHITL